ncbi:homeobox protein MSH-C [Chelonus insularis]|uniref:homeobox protein MSH-C n=1 Tax=Chelonus insularis TaxID=460826 RepID=UPI0015886706|nr:homeobox protein MSH-C [Chelonus insularis]
MSELHKFNKKSSNFSIAHILADKTTESTPPLWSIHLIKMNLIQDKLLRVNYNNNSSIDQSNYNNLVNSEVYTSSSNERIQPINKQQCEELFHDKRKIVSRSDFSWLQCTRYQPPKIPKRTFNNRACKRKPATHPRIPFTSFQLEVLEEKYRNNAYLSKKDVHHLATILRLPHNRIKIWFQNRRARDRKEIKLNSLRKA